MQTEEGGLVGGDDAPELATHPASSKADNKASGQVRMNHLEFRIDSGRFEG